MSTLNSQTELLHSLVFAGEKPPAKLLVEAGLDIELLTQTVGALKPNMDYLRGYKPLTSFYQRTYVAGKYPPFEAWIDEFADAKRFPHCIQLLDTTFIGGGSWDWFPLIPSEKLRYPGEYNTLYREDHQRWGGLRVFLTRKGKWIVWTSLPVSVFRVVADAEAAVETIKELTPPDVRLRLRHYSPALEMTEKLIDFFGESIQDKSNDVSSEVDLLAEISKPLERFA